MPALSWILNLAYAVLLMVVSPVVVYRMLVHGKYRDGWAEKFLGRLPLRNSTRPCIWFHAVSVGEVLQLPRVLEMLAQERPACEFLITTTTHTGLAVARNKFPQHRVCYFPLDFSWAVRRAIRRVRPSAIVLVELELWPNFILQAKRSWIPLALINGRISQHSYSGYRRIRPLMRRLLDCFDSFAVQSETYRERLIELGAAADRIAVTGSIKFDHVQTDRRNSKTEELRRSFGIGDAERVFIAGSTQAPEEELALETYLALRDAHPDLRLVLVPRHQERFDEVAHLVERRGLPLIRRSRTVFATPLLSPGGTFDGSPGREPWGPGSSPFSPSPSGAIERCRDEQPNRFYRPAGATAMGAPQTQGSRPGLPPSAPTGATGAFQTRSQPQPSSQPILLLDTLGELAACWGLATIAFVGGSLTKRGGQNMIEPAAYGAAVLFGPNTHNFRDVVEMLLFGDAARVVVDGDDLTAAVRDFLERPDAARRQGCRAQQLVLSQQGATEKTVRRIAQLLRATDGPGSQLSWPAA